MWLIEFISNNFLWVVEFIIMFSFLIIIHELGHFWAARWSGVKVLEFGVGFGKKLYGKKIGETEYTFNLIPFGGFVRMLGEEDRSDDPRSFEQAPLLNRMIITLGGVFMNFVSAIVILTILFTVGTNPIIVSENDKKVAYQEGYFGFKDANDNYITSKTTPWEEVKDRKDLQGGFLKEMKKPLGESFLFSFKETWRISGSILQKLSEIPSTLIQTKRLPEGMAGPLGIAEVTKKVSAFGVLYLVKLAALLSISLGVMNLLPIPALDGGRLFFQFIELILKPFKIKPSTTIENYAHIGGFMILIGFLIMVTIEDIVRIWF